jgi:transposase
MHEQAMQREVILGADAHLDLHVGAVIDSTGKLLGTLTTATTAHGYHQLIAWACTLGHLRRAGVEGTGTYGSGLARALHEQGITE